MAGDSEVTSDRVDADTVLGEQRLVLLEAVNEVLLLESLLPPARGVRRHDAALDAGLDTVGAWFPLVAADFPLLTQDTGGATSQFHGVGIKLGGEPDGYGDGARYLVMDPRHGGSGDSRWRCLCLCL
ncbi:hypothetical protein HYQ46_009721 [Verticillium longisporum]|nr:hypothetical protein HYQ46_009721 [Verticillium longisporum]